MPAGDRVMRGSSGRRDDVLALPAETLDAELHEIAGLQEGRRALAHPDPGRGSGVDEVAGLEHYELAEVVHDERRPEEHRRRRAVLPPHAVDVEPHPQ